MLINTQDSNEVARETKCGVCKGTSHNKYGQCIICLRRRNREYYRRMKELKEVFKEEV